MLLANEQALEGGIYARVTTANTKQTAVAAFRPWRGS